MLVIGLTGGIASGKTTVATILQELGAAVLDADEVAKKIVQKGKPAYKEIIKTFGRKVLTSDGDLNRKLLGKIVFNDEEKRKKLESIIHPRVKEYFLEEIQRIKEKDPQKIIVLDVPLLLESGMETLVDEVWVVAVSEELQIKRIELRDRIGRQEALKRIKAQMPLKEKLKYADRIINAEGTLEDTKRQVVSLWREITGNELEIKA
ncbi:MAG: dephospho-CoA kinase [Clostridiales bacterium]|nr:dephospho-CoA kinase [Clostridiales bacterium]